MNKAYLTVGIILLSILTLAAINLINNYSTSNSSKNKKARELGVQILTESEFLENYVNG